MFARRGFAVLLALFAIILFGALATTMVFAAAAETQASGTMLATSRSLSAAEAGVMTAISTFDWGSVLAALPGQSTRTQVGFGGQTTDIWVIRLDSTCFLVQGTAQSGPNVAGNPRFVRRIGVTIEVTRDSSGVIRVLRVPSRAWTELFQP